MTYKPRRLRVAASIIIWWSGVTLVLWLLLGQVGNEPAGLAQCAASAAYMVAVGEAGDWVRRRWRERRGRNRPGPSQR
ncbi:hypothetical protein GCM10020367_60340 [Streptomyces sannanensis]|uniref:Uncharacterized protein n=1 Tax=Streptomyces sannanensis TaxID=285536 RepID=A0ABP6SL85_9ACTN